MAVLRAILVTPLTGPLSTFGRAGADALALWARETAAPPAPFTRVDLDVRDSGREPSAALRAAVESRPHLVFGPYGSGPAVAAARATGRTIWNHGGATSALGWPDHPNVVNVLSPSSSYFHGAVGLVRAADPGARTAALRYGRTGFGADVAGGVVAAAAAHRLAVEAVGFEAGAGARAARGVAGTAADLLLVVGRFEDEREVARSLFRGGRWPDGVRAAAFVGAGADEVLADLGPDREGLLGPAQWAPAAAPQPDEGPDAAWFVRRFSAATGRPPSYPAAQAFAAGVLAARALRDAGQADDEALLAAARDLSCTTLYGPFRLDPETGRQVGHQVLTVQWQHGRRRVVWPPELAEARAVYPANRGGRGTADRGGRRELPR